MRPVQATRAPEDEEGCEEGCEVGVHELMRSRDDGRTALFVCAHCGYEEHEVQ